LKVATARYSLRYATHVRKESGSKREGSQETGQERAASGGALAPEPPHATCSQPQLYGFTPKIVFELKNISG